MIFVLKNRGENKFSRFKVIFDRKHYQINADFSGAKDMIQIHKKNNLILLPSIPLKDIFYIFNNFAQAIPQTTKLGSRNRY